MSRADRIATILDAPSFDSDLTVTGTITDDVNTNVRAPRSIQVTGGDTTESNEGVYNISSAATLTTFTIGAPAAGTVMCIYNNKSSSITLSRGSTVGIMRKGDDNNTTNHATLTLGSYSLTTITVPHQNNAIVTSTDVSVP